MNKIIDKKQFSENVFQLTIEAPRIAKNRKAGHFVIVKVGEKGERIPLTIVDSNLEQGTIDLIIQRVGVSSSKLVDLQIGDFVDDLVGPLGHATHIENFGTVVAAGGGVGLAPMLPIIRAMKEAGNRVITIIAARSKNLVILEEQIRAASSDVLVMTNDGTYGDKGLVTNGIEKIISAEKVDIVLTIGPAVMMKAVSELTQKHNIPTVASLNTIMVDGTGMCGACRVSVGGETKFVCVDGPEFDAHKVNFDEMLSRLGAYKEMEIEAMNNCNSLK
jgi:NAD(P)H-flavin reductase